MTIGAGDLNRRIQILRPTKVDNGREEIETFAPIASTFANVSYISDGEKFRAGAVEYGLSIRFIIRKRDVNLNDRIVFDGTVYGINGIKEKERIYYEITAGKTI